MSRSLQEEGEKLIREGERILRREVQGALDDGDFNIAVVGRRRSISMGLRWSQFRS